MRTRPARPQRAAHCGAAVGHDRGRAREPARSGTELRRMRRGTAAGVVSRWRFSFARSNRDAAEGAESLPNSRQGHYATDSFRLTDGRGSIPSTRPRNRITRPVVSLLTGTDLAAACQGGFSISRDKRLDPETPEIELRQDAIAAAAGTSSKLQIWNFYAVVTALLLSTQEPFYYSPQSGSVSRSLYS